MKLLSWTWQAFGLEKRRTQFSYWWCCLLFYFCINSMEKVQRTLKSVVVFICETETCTKVMTERQRLKIFQDKWRHFYSFNGGHCTYGEVQYTLTGQMYFVFCRLYPSSLQQPRQCLAPTEGIFKQSMGARNRVGIGFSYRPARLHRLAEFIPWNRFLDSINV
jgi:hypothetical protein